MIKYITITSPMCGTCEKAKEMNKVLKQIYKNIDFLELDFSKNMTLVNENKIESVPAFLIYEDNKLLEKFYAFHDVVFLHNKLKKYIGNR